MGGSGPSRVNKFLYAPAPPPPSVWALKPPSWAFVHKTTYAPMIYTALCLMFWMCVLDRVFWAPNAISQGPKNSRISGPNPLPLAL
jgi:hypothetical protein